MLCNVVLVLLYNSMNQPYVYIYRLPLKPPSLPQVNTLDPPPQYHQDKVNNCIMVCGSFITLSLFICISQYCHPHIVTFYQGALSASPGFHILLWSLFTSFPSLKHSHFLIFSFSWITPNPTKSWFQFSSVQLHTHG